MRYGNQGTIRRIGNLLEMEGVGATPLRKLQDGLMAAIKDATEMEMKAAHLVEQFCSFGVLTGEEEYQTGRRVAVRQYRLKMELKSCDRSYAEHAKERSVGTRGDGTITI